MILLIDNFDSFVYNLARYVSELGFTPLVKRNNEVTVEDILRLNPSHIIISPGPCTPNEAGISLEVVRKLGETIPILGVCLGHQAIGQAYGGKIVRALHPMHGKRSLIQHDQQHLFEGLEMPLPVARYHSLIVSEDNFPQELKVISRCPEGEIMALAHRKWPVFGVQFHPESILTTSGHALLSNFFSTGISMINVKG
jgi:anthranilate synthase/aminodeoxychorismate synthase-like glutamine amidotransferase